MAKFTIKEAPNADVGRWRIRLEKQDRLGTDRHTLLKVVHGKHSGYFVGLGHEQGKGVVLADLDVREHLRLGKPGSTAELEVELVSGWRSICWYLRHRDPYVYVPAWVGFWSLMLGGAGIALGLVDVLPAIMEALRSIC